MANHKSALKRQRRDERRRVINLNRLNRIRTFIKRVQAAVLSGNKEEATKQFNLAQPEIMRGASKGVIAKNTAARRISRLSAKIKAL